MISETAKTSRNPKGKVYIEKFSILKDTTNPEDEIKTLCAFSLEELYIELKRHLKDGWHQAETKHTTCDGKALAKTKYLIKVSKTKTNTNQVVYGRELEEKTSIVVKTYKTKRL